MDREKWKAANISESLNGEKMPVSKAGSGTKKDRETGSDRDQNRNQDSRQEQGKGDKNFVAGRKPVAELLETAPGRVDYVNLRKGRVDAKIGAIVDLCAEAGVRYKFVDSASLDRLFRGAHQGVVAQVAGLEYAEMETLLDNGLDAPLPLVLILDRVQDTGNVGALARTLYALGGAGIVVPQHEGAYIGAGAIKASAGALNMLPVAKVVNVARAVDQFAERGWMTYCAGESETSENVFDPKVRLHLPAALVLGNEEKGVRPGVAKACGRTLHIPFARKFDSLNVSSAGSALMTLFALQAASK
jgi:23S rRNA (guanosine2251-2'-O)-methyltransferase